MADFNGEPEVATTRTGVNARPAGSKPRRRYGTPLFQYPGRVTMDHLAVSRDESIADWLRAQGLRFDPFAYTESERDAYLDRYYIDHPAFRDNLTPTHGLIYAAPGAGKTATRLRLESYFRDQFPSAHTLAFAYLIGSDLPPSPKLDDYLPLSLSSGVQAAFVALALYGHELPDLARSASALAALFDSEYPMKTWRDDLQEAIRSGSLRQCLANLNLPFDEDMPPAAPGTVNVQWLRKWLSLLNDASRPVSIVALDDWAKWRLFHDTLRQAGVSSIVILVDGVDARPNPDDEVMLAIVRPLIEAMRSNALGEGVALKLFLPEQLYVPLMHVQGSDVPAYFIHWDRALLIEMIRSRLAVASEGAVQYLSQLADPAVQNLEDYLIAQSAYSPRGLIQAIRDLIDAHVESLADSEKRRRISSESVQRFRSRRLGRVGVPVASARQPEEC